MPAPKPALTCPCRDQALYTRCCGPFHGGSAAPTAEALMRSRYSAYVLGLETYLLETWHTSTRPAALGLAEQTPPAKWLGLKVLRNEESGETAIVEFIARFRLGGGSAQRQHETGRFVREDGRWFYIDGVT